MYKLIASDLDGTLLTTDKQLSTENSAELSRAFRQDTYIVPATGRILAGLPDFIRNAEWFRYCILCNGAEIYDATEGTAISRCEISPELSVRVLEFADKLPVLTDIYSDGRGFMNADMLAVFDDYVTDPHYRTLIHRLREPVDDLKSFILSRNNGVQKIQFYFRDEDLPLRRAVFAVLEKEFPELLSTTSVPFNIEINHRDANKGTALTALCHHLGITLSDTIAFGDNTNDLSMLQKAGLGVCMENGTDDAKVAADFITTDNNSHGVAAAIRRFI